MTRDGKHRTSPDTDQSSESSGGVIPPRLRDWGHVYKTRMRTSTAVLLIAFFGSVVLYGYTSQRYGVVAPPPARVTTSHTTTTEPTWTSTPSSSIAPSSTTTTTETTDSGTEGGFGTGEEQSTTTTTEQTIPGLPGIRIPGFDQQTPQTTSVPTR